MYKYVIIDDVKHILFNFTSNGHSSFPNIESNDGPEHKAYLAWVAEGNTAEEWNAE